MPIEFLDHAADIAVKLTAADPLDVIDLAVRAIGLALVGRMDGDVSLDVKGELFEMPISTDGPDFTSAIVSLLNEVLYLVEEKGAVPVGFELKSVTLCLDGCTVAGKVIFDTGWKPVEDIKAVSFGAEWSVRFIFDV